MSAEKIANDTVQDADQWQFEFDSIIPIVCSIIAISCYFCLKTFFNRLHIIIKNILIVLSIHNAIMSMIAASIFLTWNEDTSFEKCAILSIIVKSITFLAVNNLSLISYVRYHLAISWDGVSYRAYVNGDFVKEASPTEIPDTAVYPE